MSWSQTAGLTLQSGPFKFQKTDRPKSQKTPWVGGGVPGGGTLHAGNGNWFSSMNPQVIRAVPYALKPSQYAELVGPAQPSTIFKRKQFGIPSNVQVLGRNADHQTGMLHRMQPLEDGNPDQSREDEYEDALDQADNDSAVGDTSVQMHLPGEFPNQRQYVSSQPVVQPLLSVDRPTSQDASFNTSNNSIVENWTNTSRTETRETTTDTSDLPSSMEIDQPGIYLAEPTQERTVLTMEIQDHINHLTDEVNRLQNENGAMGLNASFAYTNAVNEQETIRVAARQLVAEIEAAGREENERTQAAAQHLIAEHERAGAEENERSISAAQYLVTELHTRISELEAELEASNTRFNHQDPVINPVQELINQNQKVSGIRNLPKKPFSRTREHPDDVRKTLKQISNERRVKTVKGQVAREGTKQITKKKRDLLRSNFYGDSI